MGEARHLLHHDVRFRGLPSPVRSRSADVRDSAGSPPGEQRRFPRTWPIAREVLTRALAKPERVMPLIAATIPSVHGRTAAAARTPSV